MLKFILYFLLSICTLLWSGCFSECTYNCGDHGTCVETDCLCDPGYAGATCNVRIADFLDCGEHGTINVDHCECDEGYSGNECENRRIDLIIGNWASTDLMCQSSIPFDTITFIEGPNILDVILLNPNDSDNNFLVKDYAKNFSISSEIILPNNEIFSTTGFSINSNEIYVNYNITSPTGETRFCPANYFRI